VTVEWAHGWARETAVACGVQSALLPTGKAGSLRSQPTMRLQHRMLMP